MLAVTCSPDRPANTTGADPETVEAETGATPDEAVAPVLVTEPVTLDTDDPAIPARFGAVG